MPTNKDYAASASAPIATPPTPTSNASAAPASTGKPPRFSQECVVLAILPNGTVHPVVHPPTERATQPPGIRIFDNEELALTETMSGRLAKLTCAVIQLKGLFD